MQYKSIAIALTCATTVMASPLAANDVPVAEILEPENYVEHFRESVRGGALIYLGPPNGTE